MDLHVEEEHDVPREVENTVMHVEEEEKEAEAGQHNAASTSAGVCVRRPCPFPCYALRLGSCSTSITITQCSLSTVRQGQ